MSTLVGKCLLIILLISCDGLVAQNVAGTSSFDWDPEYCGTAFGMIIDKLNILAQNIAAQEIRLESTLKNLSSKIDSLQENCNTPHLPPSANDDIYRSCKDVPSSGVFKIQPEKPFKEPMAVLCDQEYEYGGWVVIQYRFNGLTNFYRNWSEYKNGFGNLDGEFWLGLDRIYQLTASQPHELVVLLEDFDGKKAFAWYDHFEIADENRLYNLTKIDGFSGPAGDSLGNWKGMKFTTLDSDNDIAEDNCAVTFTGAWWYGACHASNLNGQYLRGDTKLTAKGMVWDTFRGFHHSLKISRMMIRPRAKIISVLTAKTEE